ncbi:hypothetical protein KP509_30G027900 [Ceratopteris richardii]|uniref:DUF659 domain-containing protein n=1 Tax=Ceratopteris richardii TaxID=49495 RepID=A0A8T2R2Q3_CERRI|nr:hypothetical protein KP509_30G027900 [Ceratopteris richardii]
MPKPKQSCWKYVTSQGKFGSGGSERWTCNLCGYKGGGGADRIKAHLAKFSGLGISACKQPMPADIKDELLEWVAQREARKYPQSSRPTSTSISSSYPPPHDAPAHQTHMGSSSGGNDEHGHDTVDLEGDTQPPVKAPRGSLSSASVRAGFQRRRELEAKQGIMKLFIQCGLSFNVARTPAWKEAMELVSTLGYRWSGPSYEELRTSELRKTKDIVEKQLQPMMGTWEKYGCTIMCDGWTDIRKRNVYNILVHCCKGTMFLRAIDALEPGLTVTGMYSMYYVLCTWLIWCNFCVTGQFIYGHIRQAIMDVGQKNVVQVITDNGSNCVAMGRLLEAEFPSIVWTPCAAHSIDLLIEDLGKIPWIHSIFSTCHKVVSLFTKRPKLLAIFRSYSELDILKPAKTRFAYMCIVMERLLRVRQALMQTVVSTEWTAWDGHTTPRADFVRITCLSDSFWRDVEALVRAIHPLYSVFRIVDMEGSTLGLVYEFMDRVGESLSRCPHLTLDRIEELKAVWRDRWDWFHRPIHGMAHLLHPLWRSQQAIVDEELLSAWNTYVYRLYPADVELRLQLERQLLVIQMVVAILERIRLV